MKTEEFRSQSTTSPWSNWQRERNKYQLEARISSAWKTQNNCHRENPKKLPVRKMLLLKIRNDIPSASISMLQITLRRFEQCKNKHFGFLLTVHTYQCSSCLSLWVVATREDCVGRATSRIFSICNWKSNKLPLKLLSFYLMEFQHCTSWLHRNDKTGRQTAWLEVTRCV